MSDTSNLPVPTAPGYGATEQPATAPYPQPGQGWQPQPQVYPTEPPPKYEEPKNGPYAEQYPPQQYPPQQGYQTTQPVAQHTVIVTSERFGPYPMTLDCPNCHALITTEIDYTSGGLTWLTSGLLCLLGCWAGCCLIPFCVPDLQDVTHRCPNCGRHIGTYSRL